MKRIYCISAALLVFAACQKESPDNGGGNPDVLTCEITAPADGMEIDLAESAEITISGKAEVTSGKISSVELKVGDEAIESVQEVPFECKYIFKEESEAVVISLTVVSETGVSASDQVTVKVIRTSDTPQPEENEFLDPRDNKIYKTVKIGEQTWFAENLAYLPRVDKPMTAKECEGEQLYYVLNYDGEDIAAAKATEEYGRYGVLYNWYAAMGEDNASGIGTEEAKGPQGPCPDGWHVPGYVEWRTLSDYVASQLPPVKGNGMYIDVIPGEEHWEYEEGLKNVWSALAGLEGWGESAMSGENPDLAEGPRDTYGFNVIPAGQCFQTGTFENPVSMANTSFWAPHKLDQGGATITFSNNDYDLAFSKYGTIETRGYSIRCIKD